MGRITVVQALKLDDGTAQDYSNLFINVNYANPEEMYRQWITYRMHDLQQMLDAEIDRLGELSIGETADVAKIVKQLDFIQEHIDNTKESLLTNGRRKAHWIQTGSLRKSVALKQPFDDITNMFINVQVSKFEESKFQEMFDFVINLGYVTHRMQSLRRKVDAEVGKLDKLSVGDTIGVVETTRYLAFMQEHIASTKESLLAKQSTRRKPLPTLLGSQVACEMVDYLKKLASPQALRHTEQN